MVLHSIHPKNSIEWINNRPSKQLGNRTPNDIVFRKGPTLPPFRAEAEQEDEHATSGVEMDPGADEAPAENTHDVIDLTQANLGLVSPDSALLAELDAEDKRNARFLDETTKLRFRNASVMMARSNFSARDKVCLEAKWHSNSNWRSTAPNWSYEWAS